MLRMGEVVRIVELAERMIRLRGLVPHKDIKIESIGIRPGEKLHEELRSESEHEIPTIHPHIVELTHGKNGFTPDSLFDTLTRLTEQGLDANKTAIDQLAEIIGSYEHLHGLTQDNSIEVAG